MLNILVEKAESALHFGRLDCRTVWLHVLAQLYNDWPWSGEAGFCGVSLDKNMDPERHTFDFATPAGFAQGAQIVPTCMYAFRNSIYIYIYLSLSLSFLRIFCTV